MNMPQQYNPYNQQQNYPYPQQPINPNQPAYNQIPAESPKRGPILLILLILIIIVLAIGIFLFFNTGGETKLPKVKEESSISKPEQINLIPKCEADFNECKKIQESNLGSSIKINKIEQFNNYKDARDFLQTWGDVAMLDSSSQSYDESTAELPFVFIVTSLPLGMSEMTFVFACDKEGKLSETSKKGLGCSQKVSQQTKISSIEAKNIAGKIMSEKVKTGYDLLTIEEPSLEDMAWVVPFSDKPGGEKFSLVYVDDFTGDVFKICIPSIQECYYGDEINDLYWNISSAPSR